MQDQLSRPRATVVVCTQNRSRLLAAACDAILAVDYPAERWEMVIVDNRSRDDTLAVAREIAGQYAGRVRVVEETEIGLSAARNAGYRAARGEIIAYVDDDAFPVPGWLRGLDEALGRDGVLAAGGPVVPRFTGALPEWLGARYLPYLSAWDLGPAIVELTYNEFPRGTNVAFRREAFARFGLFAPFLGRKGRSLLSCEETELCLRLERGGAKVVYTPAARVEHVVHAERITEQWLLDRFAAQGASEAIVDWRHGGWPGLRRGWRRFRRYAEDAARTTGDGSALFRRCQRQSFTAYTRRALRCPLTVPRYRPTAAAGPVAPWLPFP